jgi:hypothetical protein
MGKAIEMRKLHISRDLEISTSCGYRNVLKHHYRLISVLFQKAISVAFAKTIKMKKNTSS